MTKTSANFAKQLAYVASMTCVMWSGLGIALAAFGAYRCPLTNAEGVLWPLCENTYSAMAGSLLLIGVAALMTRLWAESPRPTRILLLGAASSLFWLAILEISIGLRT